MIKSLKIGPIEYRIVVEKLGNKWGWVDLRRHVIHICEGYPKKDQLMTVLHEALHAISSQAGVNQVLEDDEFVVRAYENFICMLFTQNKTFAKELLREMGK